MVCLELSASADLKLVGTKAARLSGAGIPYPRSFVVVAPESERVLARLPLAGALSRLDPEDPLSLFETSKKIYSLVLESELPAAFIDSVALFAAKMGAKLAVRSSAILEDTDKLSFAGQYDSFLDVDNDPKTLVEYIKRVWASLYTARAISYRHHNKIPQVGHSMAVLIQDMIEGPSGVLFTVNPNTGKRELLLEFAFRGVVHGRETARTIFIRGQDDIKAYPPLSEADVTLLVTYAKVLTDKYKCALDIEWVRNPHGTLIPLQVRPLLTRQETQQRHVTAVMPLLIGSPVGSGVVSGVVQKVSSPADPSFKKGNILVVRDTSPEWEPLMRKASALITDHGCRTSHAALTSMEMDLPAVVGAGDATAVLADGQLVTVDLFQDCGFVYGGDHIGLSGNN